MVKRKAPLTADRAIAVVAYFRRLLASANGAAVLRVADGSLAHRELDAAAAVPSSAGRTMAVEAWLAKWVLPAARERCFRAVRQAARRKVHGRLPRPDVPEQAWAKVKMLAESAKVSPQVALEGLVDFVMAEPSRSRAAVRFICVQGQMPTHTKRSTTVKQ